MSRNGIEFGSSNTQKKGVSLFGFPKDAKMKRAWTLEVHGGKEHFSEDCLNPLSVTSKKLGIKMKQMLSLYSISTIRYIILYKPKLTIALGLCALHYNHNSSKEHAVTRAGEE